MGDIRPLLLGEAPSKSGDRYHDFPLSGAVGQRLCEMAGIEPEVKGSRYGRYYWPLLDHFELRNLIERYPGPQGRGASFPMEVARQRAGALELKWRMVGAVVVLLGARLPGAFDLDMDFYEQRIKTLSRVTGTSVRFYCIPHPSGLNRMYNAERERERAGQVLREAMERAMNSGA